MHRTSRKKANNTPAWVVTFADMMALLLTFFIMLLSFSTMDTQKYKAVVKSMEEAFGPGTGKDLQGLLGEKPHLTGGDTSDINPESLKGINKEVQDNKKSTLTPIQKAKTLLEKEFNQGTVQIEMTNDGLLIRFPERVSFPSGSATLSPAFSPVIKKLKQTLMEIPGKIIISGHSDDQPINTFRYRSNWELSTARAVSVLEAIIADGDINENRFVVEGYADTHPLKDNHSIQNRAENRRVEILIKGDKTQDK